VVEGLVVMVQKLAILVVVFDSQRLGFWQDLE
jgi:hypothetical protein